MLKVEALSVNKVDIRTLRAGTIFCIPTANVGHVIYLKLPNQQIVEFSSNGTMSTAAEDLNMEVCILGEVLGTLSILPQ